jgi:hypothetical protein
MALALVGLVFVVAAVHRLASVPPAPAPVRRYRGYLS